MNGFAYSIQTETASRRRESRSRGICLLNFPAIDLYRNVAVQKRIRQALNRLEELNPSAFNLVRLKSGTDEDYAFHAGISYTAGSELIKGHCESPEFLMVTSMLASQSIFVPL